MSASARPSVSDQEPITLVIFGASGDLTRRKLVPALFSLACSGLLPPLLRILGLGRTQLSDDSFREQMLAGARQYARLSPHQCAKWMDFAPRLQYLQMDYTTREGFLALTHYLNSLDAGYGLSQESRRLLFYLAVPPILYPTIIAHLGAVGLSQSKAGWTRIIIEKPFGHDRPSAQELNYQIHQVFNESQVYRIDHYLGKETVQNLLVFRFANAIFEPLWNRNYIDHIQITMAESIGIEHRGRYYDHAGILRDMFQNHILQLLSLVSLEPMASFDAKSLRDEKVKVLRAVRCLDAIKDSVRGQYSGYRSEPHVAGDSQTATFGALKVFVDNWRWRDVPFYLRSGKRLARKITEIVVQFKAVPHWVFAPSPKDKISSNMLAICIQPDEGIHLRFEVKAPGAGMRTTSVDMEYHYHRDRLISILPDAYERLLLDALQGDASLFARSDEIERAWELIDPIQEAWDSGAIPLHLYAAGSWGPQAADELLARDGRRWQTGCNNHKPQLVPEETK